MRNYIYLPLNMSEVSIHIERGVNTFNGSSGLRDGYAVFDAIQGVHVTVTHTEVPLLGHHNLIATASAQQDNADWRNGWVIISCAERVNAGDTLERISDPSVKVTIFHQP